MTADESSGRVTIDGREAAYRAVLAALSGQRFVGDKLAGLRRAGRLSGRDAPLALQIAAGTLRHAITIARVLKVVARYDEQRVRTSLRAILLTAAYQIIWMDRIPPFAAVNEAAELARRHVGNRSVGMVNGMLRSLTRAMDDSRVPWEPDDPRLIRVGWDNACAFTSDVLPPTDPSGNSIAHLAAATGERAQRYRALVERFGPAQAEAVAWASQAIPVTVLQRNSLRTIADEFEQQISSAYGAGAECGEDAAFLPPQVHFTETSLFRDGLVYAQDRTAQAAAALLEPQPGERVLDYCAAPGGKSLALALLMQDRGELVACDISDGRLARVRGNAARLQLNCIRTHLLPREDDAGGGLSGDFDAALVDVPCSNTGVIARRPEARLGFTQRKLASLVELQGHLLRKAAACVRRGGRMVYSTCSVEPEENNQIIAAFTAQRPDWRVVMQETSLPTWGPRLSDWRDGGFAARLERST